MLHSLDTERAAKEATERQENNIINAGKEDISCVGDG
jgi:hypothetical protein